jgi:drug/metabolite transporter (DMT)-like permease
MLQSQENIALILVLIWSFINATSFTVVQLIAGDISASVQVFLRMLIAILCFIPIALFDASIKIPSFADLLKYAVTGCFFGFYLWATFAAIESTSVNIAVIFTLNPGLAGIASWFFLRENITFSIIAGLLCGFTGTVWIILSQTSELSLLEEINHGDFIFILGSISYALFVTLLKACQFKSSGTNNSFWVILFTTIVLFCICLFDIGNLSFFNITEKVWWGLFYLATIATVVTVYILQYASPILGPVRVMAFTYLIPMQVLFINLSIGITSFDWLLLPPVIVTLLGTWLVQVNISLPETETIKESD